MNVDQARDLLVSSLRDLRRATVPLPAALGLILADDVLTRVPHPPFARALKDGYTLLAGATAGATEENPVSFHVGRRIAAGELFDHALASGEAARILTGGPLPTGADAVLAQEHAELDGDTLVIRAPVAVGAEVEPRGQMWDTSEELLEAGRRITPVSLALAATAGVDELQVRPRPVVGILATGSELVRPGAPLDRGQAPASNPVLLAELVRLAGGVPRDLGLVADHFETIAGKIEEALAECDLLLTTGGTGPGDLDLVARAALTAGVDILFDRVAQRPGRSLVGGVRKNATFLGLPGRPVAALVCFEMFARPVIRRLLGRRTLGLPSLLGKIDCELTKRPGRTRWVAVRQADDGVDVTRFSVVHTQGGLRDYLGAHGIAELPVDLDRVGPETPVIIHLLPDAYRC
jgi:molybdopterin molybdotransferase